MPKNVILNFPISSPPGPHHQEQLTATAQLAQENGQFYTRLTTQNGIAVERPWQPIYSPPTPAPNA